MTRYAFVFCFVAVGLAAKAQVLSEGRTRTRWATAFPEGPVKALFLARHGAHRDTDEILRRFAIQGRVIPLANDATKEYLKAEFGQAFIYDYKVYRSASQVLNDVRQAVIGDWEVLVMSRPPLWTDYPEDLRHAILEKVAAGRGLFTCAGIGEMADDLKTRGLALEKLDWGKIHFGNDRAEVDNRGELAVFRCGKGHVAFLTKSGHPDTGYLLSDSALQADFERSAARVGWMLRRLAHPSTVPCLSAVQVADGKVQASLAAEGGRKLMVVIRHRDTYRKMTVMERNVKDRGKVEMPLGQLPTGSHLAEIRVLDKDGGTMDWAVGAFAVINPVGNPSLELSRNEVKSGDEITCRFVNVKDATGIKQIRTCWYDNHGRLLREIPLPFATTFRLMTPDGSRSVLNRVEVSLMSKRGLEALMTAEVTMSRQTPATDFYMLYWNSGINPAWRSQLTWDTLRRHGLADAFSNCGAEAIHARLAAQANLRTIPYTTAFHGILLDEQLFSDDWLGRTENQAASTAKVQGPYGPLGYTLGDENYVNAFRAEGRFSNKPTVWEKFITYLKETYPNLRALNGQWGTAFADWSAIRFADEAAMLANWDNPSAWVDYRMFVSRQFASAHQRMRRAIQKEDPGASVGFDGSEQFSSYDGYDWWQMTRDMDLLNVYAHYLVPERLPLKVFNGEAMQSFRPDARIRGGWLNGGDGPFGVQYSAWYLFLNGWNSLWWWHATFAGPEVQAMTWNLELTPNAGAAVAAAREIKAGPATLLARARKQWDPIAVHYSENNVHASTIESGVGNHINNLGLNRELWSAPNLPNRIIKDAVMEKTWGGIKPAGHYVSSSKNFYLLLHDLGFQPRTMARQEIEAGGLAKDKMKVLILPFVVSLSHTEVEKIKTFVESGGVLIADYRCGLRDLHGRLQAKGALDEVFGIDRREPGVQRSRYQVTMDVEQEGIGTRMSGKFRETLVPGAKTRVWACHEDGIPAVLLHEYGQGLAIYLNTDLSGYEDARQQGIEESAREFFRRLLVAREANTASDRGVQSVFPVLDACGHPLGRTAVTRFRDGNTWYFGLLPDYHVENRAPKRVRLVFPAGPHIYDVRHQRYLNDKAEVETVVKPGQAQMYAALPYRIVEISASGPAKGPRGKLVDIAISIAGTAQTVGPHTIYVQVVYPDGTVPEFYARTVYLPAGRGTFSFVPALNEPVGLWNIKVTEAVSGQMAQVQLNVK